MTDTVQGASPFDQPRAITAAILLSCLGVLAIMLMPILNAAFVGTGLAEGSAAGITAAEALGTALACLAAAFWIQRVDWRLAAAVAVIVIIAGNALTATTTGFAGLLVLRFLIGFLGGGTAFAVAMSMLGSTTQKDRNFALAIAAQVLVGVLAFQLNLPRAIWGVPGVVLPVAVFAAVVVLAIPWVPRHIKPDATAGQAGPAQANPIPGLALVALGVMLVWCTGLGAIWAFVQLIGEAGGIEAVRVGQILGVTTLIGTLGALAAAWLAGRAGRIAPVTIALVVQILMISLLQGELGWLRFLATAATFQIFWNLTGPYIMGTIALADTSGRASVLIPAAQIGGFFLGPVIVGGLLTGQGLAPANAVAITCCLLALIFFIPTALRLGRQTAAAPPRAEPGPRSAS